MSLRNVQLVLDLGIIVLACIATLWALWIAIPWVIVNVWKWHQFGTARGTCKI